MISRLLAGSEFIENMFTFLQNAMASVNIDYLLLIALGIIAVIIIIGALRVVFSYESVAMRRIRKVNKYLIKNNVVTDENLVEFHRQMKKLPRRIRDRWQLFMLEREGMPSRYLTTEYCVKRALENSVTENVMKQTKTITVVLSLLTFVLGLFCRLNEAGTVSMANIIYVVLYAAIIPVVIGLLGFLFVMILQARISAVNRDFYDSFTMFVRNVDKATNTMPDYVDYELLFTRKEINDGIPILREYLEKRALEEQRLLEKAKREAVEHSPYNFDDLGVNGSQLIERAVHESESFLLNKMNLQNEITEYERQLSQAEKNMDDIEKEANKKLQVIKENLERLDKANSETTNRVEINYNRRQAKDEMDKKAAIEKDLEGALAKEQTAIDGFNVEIQRRKQDIETSREGVESALKSEYNTFATKVYDELSAKVTEENSNLVREYEAQIVQMKATIRQLTSNLEQSNTMLQVKQLELDNVRNYGASAGTFVPPVQIQNLYPDANGYGAEQQGYDPNMTPDAGGQNLFDQTAMPQQGDGQNAGQYYDENGNIVDNNAYYDENGNMIDYSQYYGNNGTTENVDATQYYDENGNLINYSQYYDENGNYIYQDQNANQSDMQQAPMQPYDENGQVQMDANAEQGDVSQQTFEAQNGEQTTDVPNYDSSNEPEPTASDATGETQTSGFDWNQLYDENGNIVDMTNNSEESGDEDDGGKKPKAESASKSETKKTSKAVKDATEAKEKAEQAKLDAEFAAEQAKAEAEKVKVEAKEAVDKAKAEATQHVEKAKAEAVEVAEKAKAEAMEVVDKAKAEATQQVEKAKEETEDLKKIQEQIAEENQKLIKQQQELRQQIDETLQSIGKSNKKSDKAKNIAKIKALIEKLKIQAKEAKASGSKEQVKQINKSVAELVAAIANYNK